MTDTSKELPIPEELNPEDAVEILRTWFSDGILHFALRADFFERPEEIGEMVAELCMRSAGLYGTSEEEVAAAFEGIMHGLEERLELAVEGNEDEAEE